MRLSSHSNICVKIKDLESKLDNLNHLLLTKADEIFFMKKKLNFDNLQKSLLKGDFIPHRKPKKNSAEATLKNIKPKKDSVLSHAKEFFNEKMRKCSTEYNSSFDTNKRKNMNSLRNSPDSLTNS